MPRHLEISDSDLLIGNVLLQLADVLLCFNKSRASEPLLTAPPCPVETTEIFELITNPSRPHKEYRLTLR